VLRRVFPCAFLALFVPVCAWAQAGTPPTVPADPDAVRWLYEVSAGAGQRSSEGRLTSPPSGAPDPASLRWIASVALVGGATKNRFSLLGGFDIAAGRQTGNGFWGGMGVFGLGRVQATHRLWLEAGGGAAQLAYRPPPQLSLVSQSYWGPEVVGGGGWQIFRTSDFAMSLQGRIASARFDTLTVRTVSFQLGLTGWH